MNLDERTYYEILGVDQTAGMAEIDAAYQSLCGLFGPDGDQPDQGAFARIHQAYEVLRDPVRRERFDKLLMEVMPSIKSQIQVSTQQIPIIPESQLVYALVRLWSLESERSAALPLNLSLVIDHSTSMKGNRLQLVQQALMLLVPTLASGDHLSIVGFSDRAELVLPAGPVGEHKGQMAWLEGLEASGGTEIFQGLLAGVRQLQKVALTEYNNQLVLLTDGRTYGDEAKCLQLAQEAADLGIAIHAFGIGAEWDDEFLDNLVKPSGGLVEFLGTPGRIVTSLQTRLKSIGEIHARGISLRVQWPPGVALQDGFRLTPYAQDVAEDGDKIHLGNLEGSNSLALLLVFTVEPQSIESRIRIPLLIAAEIPGKGLQTLREQIELTVTPTPPPYEPPPEVVKAARLRTLVRINERAWKQIALGNMDEAAVQMRYLSTRLLEIGESALARQAVVEAEELGRTGLLSLDGRKAIKYGTRALTRKTLQLDWDDTV